MLQLATPAYLLLALGVPPLLWWWWRRPRRALRHSVAGRLAGLPVGRAWLARVAGVVLRGLALLLLVLALAGPRWPDLQTPIKTEGIALMMVVDTSGSMAERDFDWDGEPISRLEAVKRVFRLFVAGSKGQPVPGAGSEVFEGRPTDLVGLVTFATRPEATCPLTLSHSTLLQMLDAEQPRTVPGESETNLSDAIVLGLHRLHGAGPRRRVLVVLTDGEHNRAHPSSAWTPRQVAQVAAGVGVPIYTIDAGPPETAPERAPLEPVPPGSSSPGAVRVQAEQTLRDLSGLTGGQYFAGRDTGALIGACRSIDRLERQEIQSFQYRRYHEAYPWLGLSALVLFGTALALESTLWRRLPLSSCVTPLPTPGSSWH